MLKLIINADDLGASAEINEAVFEQMAAGRITSATFMATGPSLDAALKRSGLFRRASFGVHLDITGFPSLSRSTELDAFRGKAQKELGRLRREPIKQSLKAAVYQEWRLQLERLISAGVLVTHVDSHHHTHTIPGLFWVLRAVLKDFGIAKLRLSKNLFIEKQPWTHVLKKKLWNTAIKAACGSVTTQGFADFATFVKATLARHLPYKTFEAMVHPGTPEYQPETDMLSTEWVSKSFNRVELISYADLTR